MVFTHRGYQTTMDSYQPKFSQSLSVLLTTTPSVVATVAGTIGAPAVRVKQVPSRLPCRVPFVKTTLERCGPFSLVVLSQRRSQVTPLSGHSDQNASETFSNKLQLNKVQSSLRQTSAKTTQVRSKAKTS